MTAPKTAPPCKAVILARSLGTRMRQRDAQASLNAAQARAADAGVKALMPIDRPFLDYVLHALAQAGFTRVCLVIGPSPPAPKPRPSCTTGARTISNASPP